MYVITLSGKVKDFDMLHYVASILECRMRWCTLVPINAKYYVNRGLLTKALISTKKDEDSLLLKIHKQKIDLSNALYVYFSDDMLFKDYINSDTLKEMKYAMDKGLDIYISSIPTDINDEYTYNEYLDLYIKPSKYMILDGGDYRSDRIVNGWPKYVFKTVNLIRLDYLDKKSYERGKLHGIIK